MPDQVAVPAPAMSVKSTLLRVALAAVIVRWVPAALVCIRTRLVTLAPARVKPFVQVKLVALSMHKSVFAAVPLRV